MFSGPRYVHTKRYRHISMNIGAYRDISVYIDYVFRRVHINKRRRREHILTTFFGGRARTHHELFVPVLLSHLRANIIPYMGIYGYIQNKDTIMSFASEIERFSAACAYVHSLVTKPFSERFQEQVHRDVPICTDIYVPIYM
jgi:hypothetical protein